MALQFAARAATTVLMAGALAGASLSASAASYSAVYAFGDSLSDTGNLLTATGGLLPQPSDYYQGRFSNGKAAVEYLAAGLGVSLFNYAYGGAETGVKNGAMVQANASAALQNTGVLSQVGFYQSALAGSSADANALYFVWAGANDFQYEGYSQAVAQAAIGNLATTIQTLYGLGARSFLVPGLPDLGITPSGLASGSSQLLQGLSASFNAGLTQTLNQLGALPGIDITYFDTFTAQHVLTAQQAAAGMNVTNACFSGAVGVGGTQCSDPGNYFYWDRIHPTASTHQILGAQMLAAVPEASTVLMMGAGLFALLGAVRRQRIGSSKAA